VRIKKKGGKLSSALLMPIKMTAMAVDYDLVMLNGRVMDPKTMCDDIALSASKTEGSPLRL